MALARVSCSLMPMPTCTASHQTCRRQTGAAVRHVRAISASAATRAASRARRVALASARLRAASARRKPASLIGASARRASPRPPPLRIVERSTTWPAPVRGPGRGGCTLGKSRDRGTPPLGAAGPCCCER
eukprot:scaffold8418_cov106-Isochrysis_galbana.AAC.3